MKKPVVIAHRGASAYAPENTMAAFRKAVEMGAGGIELDVQLTRDGHLVVLHDETVDRTSDGSGWVKDCTLEELRTLDFGKKFSSEYEGEKLPGLEEVMELLQSWKGILNIEMKNGIVRYEGMEEKVYRLIRKYRMEDRVIVSSFNHYSLVDFKRIAPQIDTGVLYTEGLFEPWDYARRLGAAAIHPWYYNIVPPVMEGCIRSGIGVNPYTIDRPEDIERMAAAGVDGIITNVPDIAVKVLSNLTIYK